jgi:Rrf2 family transcriptional regulator, cysteine metabolism repressor
MIRISTKGRYGTRLMLALALSYGKTPMLLKEIAQQEEISEGYLQHIIDALKGAGMIHSNRVGHGGYTLTRSPADITLLEILNVLEGSTSLVECVEKPDVCSRSGSCVSRDVWTELDKKLSDTLGGITLNDMVERKNRKSEQFIHYEI